LLSGETIEVLSTTDPGAGWWTGRRHETEDEGIFPANHITLLESSPTSSTGADDSEPTIASASQKTMPIFEADETTEEAESERVSKAAVCTRNQSASCWCFLCLS
jgi:hypothetical protein